MAKLLILAGSILGIALLVVMAKYLWPSRSALSKEHALRRYTHENPDDKISQTIVSNDAGACLFLLEDSHYLGLVYLMGDRLTVRRIPRSDVSGALVNDNNIALTLNDFTMPQITFTLDSLSDRQVIAGLASDAILHAQNKEVQNA